MRNMTCMLSSYKFVPTDTSSAVILVANWMYKVLALTGTLLLM